MEALIPFMFIILFPILFVGIVALIAYSGGWISLQKQFPFNEYSHSSLTPIIDSRISGLSLKLGFMGNYRNTIVVTEYLEGIKIQPFLVYRAFHKPIFLRWEDIKETKVETFLFFERFRIRVFSADLVFSGFGVKRLQKMCSKVK